MPSYVMVVCETMTAYHVSVRLFDFVFCWGWVGRFHYTKNKFPSKRDFRNCMRTPGPQVLLETNQSSLWECPRPSRAAIPRHLATQNLIPKLNSVENRFVHRFADIHFICADVKTFCKWSHTCITFIK